MRKIPTDVREIEELLRDRIRISTFKERSSETEQVYIRIGGYREAAKDIAAILDGDLTILGDPSVLGPKDRS